jgi:hypothetical protein
VLELIMTAPVVVASWISLQYYGSSVAPEAFGGGNKLIHNVVGGIGVVEGNGGSLCPACHGSRSMMARTPGAAFLRGQGFDCACASCITCFLSIQSASATSPYRLDLGVPGCD